MLRAHIFFKSVGVTSVRAQDRLIYFIKCLAHFIPVQYADYFTYNNTDLLLTRGSRIRYTIYISIHILKKERNVLAFFCKRTECSLVLFRILQKNVAIFAFFSVLCKRTFGSLRSFPFFRYSKNGTVRVQDRLTLFPY